MILKTGILIFFVLLNSSQDFTVQKDFSERGNVQGSMALGQSGILPGRSWIEDPSDDSSFDLKEQFNSPARVELPGISFRSIVKTGQNIISRLDPLFLDRPPPRNAFSSRMIVTA